jgi:hypothetical protein
MFHLTSKVRGLYSEDLSGQLSADFSTSAAAMTESTIAPQSGTKNSASGFELREFAKY